MPIATPALELGAVANANPPATSAIKRSFFMFLCSLLQTYQLNIRYDGKLLKLFDRSNRPIFRIARNQKILANLFISHPLNARRLVRSALSRAGKGDYRAARQNGSQINLHLVDHLFIKGLAEHISAALDQYVDHIFSPQIAQN